MTRSSVHHLFVYGSLRSGFRSPAYEYISRYFTIVGDAKVRGKLYDMGRFPAGVPSAQDEFIIGELYKIRDEKEFSWAIGQLDDYEGVSVEPDEIQLYRRETTEVFCKEKNELAWIYWYSADTSGKKTIASGDLMEHMQQKK